jgi:hypothetical protein
VRPSGWNLRLLALRILRWLLYFGNICVPPIHSSLEHFQHAFLAVLNSSQARCLLHRPAVRAYLHLTSHTAFWSYSYLHVVKNSSY